MTVVDIHCHNFNGADLPVQGFVRTVIAEQYGYARPFDRVIERMIQGRAIGGMEIPALEARLRQVDEGADIPSLEAVSTSLPDIDAVSETLFEELRTREPDLVAAAEAEARAGKHTARVAVGTLGLGDKLAEFERAKKLAGLLTMSRLELTYRLVAQYPDVDVFTPMLVDFYGLDGDSPVTSVHEQIVLQDLLSRLAVRGFFGGKHVLPFIGFHPLRPDGFDLVRLAVECHGFVGVKLYPPIGFRPSGNVASRPRWMSPAQAQLADDNLTRLYGYCVDNAVPITAHGNLSNWADSTFKHFSAPSEWKRVLQQHKGLRLNLGHFGWADKSWPGQLVEMMGPDTNVYVDIANFEKKHLARDLNRIAELAVTQRDLLDRLMYGSDWSMAVMNADHEGYYSSVSDGLLGRFGEKHADIMGDNALRFLGLVGEPGNANLERVRSRYNAVGAKAPW